MKLSKRTREVMDLPRAIAEVKIPEHPLRLSMDGVIQPRPPMIRFPELIEPIQPKVKTVQLGNRLMILDGKSPLRYVDLTTNKVHVYEAPGERIPVRVLTEIRPDTVIENRGGKAYFVRTII